MALLRRHKKAPTPADETATEPEPAPEGRLSAYDAYVRAVSLTRDEYRTRVLPASLRKNWDNPPGLYSAIVQGLRDDFAADLLDASAHLVELDPDPERASAARGIVLLKTGDLDGAEDVLRRYHGTHDPSGVILTNMAKVAAERGDHERSHDLLAEALQIDPNLENGLLWWAALARETGGEDAYLEALDIIAEVQGSWRPQLWLARHRLDEGDLDGALDLYRAVLELAADQSDALLMISGDLGNAGHVDEVFELVLPRYVPERHALSVGFNLLNACVQANHRAEGEALLHRIGLLNAPHARDQVAAFARSLDQLKAAELGPPEPAEPEAAPTIVDVPRPLWHTYLGRPDWLLPSVPRRAKVGILTLADATAEDAGTALLDLGQQLVGRLVNEAKASAVSEPTHYTVPTGALLDGYLAASDELFALTLAGEGLTDPQRLYGERDILNHLLSLTVANRQVLLPKLMFLAALVLNRARGSTIYQEFRSPAVAMADAEKDPASDGFA